MLCFIYKTQQSNKRLTYPKKRHSTSTLQRAVRNIRLICQILCTFNRRNHPLNS